MNCRNIGIMTETTKLKDIVAGKNNYKVLGRLIRIWDSRYANSNALISVYGILLDVDVNILNHF
jgi:replication factor A1